MFSWWSAGERIIFLEYAALSIFILLPIFKPGYIFALDFTAAPHFDFPSTVSFEYPWLVFLWLLNLFIPAAVIQKIICFAILFLAGIGAHYFVGKFSSTKWSKYFAGLLFIFNPLVYSRLAYGQFRFLLGYALLPWLFLAGLRFLKQPLIKKTFYLALLLTVCGAVSLHILFIFSFVFIATWLTRFFQSIYNRNYLFEFLKQTVFLLLLFLFLNSYWLLPVFVNHSSVNNALSSFDQRDVFGFQTNADSRFGVFVNTAAMYGFWGDREGRYFSQKTVVSYWFVLFLVLLFFVFWGVGLLFWKLIKKYHQFRLLTNPSVAQLKDERLSEDIWLALPIFFCAVVALFMAVGVAHPFSALISQWLYQNFSFYKGFREPQKWVVVLILAYTYFASFGVDDLVKKAARGLEYLARRANQLKTKKPILFLLSVFRKVLPVIFLIVPLFYSPILLLGLGRQMCVGSYPASWYESNELLNSDQENFQTLFLPWHMYLNLSFACNKVVTNPAAAFFDKPFIVGDNIEFGNIYNQNNRADSKYVEENILQNKGRFTQKDGGGLGEVLNTINVKYVVWAKESDFFNYDFVKLAPDLELVYDRDRIQIYKNLKWQDEKNR